MAHGRHIKRHGSAARLYDLFRILRDNCRLFVCLGFLDRYEISDWRGLEGATDCIDAQAGFFSYLPWDALRAMAATIFALAFNRSILRRLNIARRLQQLGIAPNMLVSLPHLNCRDCFRTMASCAPCDPAIAALAAIGAATCPAIWVTTGRNSAPSST